MSDKQVRGQYTQEFKLEAVGQVKAGQSVSSRPCKIRLAVTHRKRRDLRSVL